MTTDTRPPAAFVHGLDGPVVVVSAKVASRLLAIPVLHDWHAAHRGDDPELDAVIVALKVAAAGYRPACADASPAPQVSQPATTGRRMTVSEAARALHLTGSAVRLAIAEGRLKATKVDDRWRIEPTDLTTYHTRPRTRKATT